TAVLDLRRLREEHLRPADVAVRGGEREPRVVTAELDASDWRKRLRVQRVAEGEVVMLDGEDVREIVRELQLERKRERTVRVTAHGERVLHPARDVTRARDRQLVA